MELIDIIAILVIAAIIGSSSYYIYRAKKSGKKCIGCPNSSSCSDNCSSCRCNCNKDK